MQKIKIVIADDHEMIAEGVRSLLNGVGNMEVIADVKNGKQLLEIISLITPEIVLMDVDMPKMDGFEASRIIKEKHPKVKIIVLTVHDELGIISKLKGFGVDGYVLKNVDQKELITAIETVHGGEKYFSRAVTESIIENLNTPQNKIHTVKLTDREIEILKLIAEGYSNTEIGRKLFISHRTVDTHRTNLMKKIEVKNIAGLIKYALRNGLVN